MRALMNEQRRPTESFPCLVTSLASPAASPHFAGCQLGPTSKKPARVGDVEMHCEVSHLLLNLTGLLTPGLQDGVRSHPAVEKTAAVT